MGRRRSCSFITFFLVSLACACYIAHRRRRLAGRRTTLHAASEGGAAGKNCNLPVDNHICRIEFLGAVPDGYLLYAAARRTRRRSRASAARSYAQRTPNAKVSSMHERRKSRSKVFALTIGWLLKRTLESGL
jgi:hypothetical protein